MVFYTTPVVDTVWTYMEAVFMASTDRLQYITCTVDMAVIDTLLSTTAYLDHFQLEALVGIPEQSVQAQPRPSQLLRIVDVLGRETQPKPNTPLFYIYDDGRVEKRMTIE